MSKILVNQAFFHGMASLYYLIIHADGNVHEKELKTGELMCLEEGIDPIEFKKFLKSLEQKDKDEILTLCLISLKQCEKDDQIRIVAWMSMITNCDGFLDSTEWDVIYQIYYKELGLNLAEILKIQKALLSSTAA